MMLILNVSVKLNMMIKVFCSFNQELEECLTSWSIWT